MVKPFSETLSDLPCCEADEGTFSCCSKTSATSFSFGFEGAARGCEEDVDSAAESVLPASKSVMLPYNRGQRRTADNEMLNLLLSQE